jgi:hypothetical protein
MYPHRIRLRGPWEMDVVSLGGELSTTRVTMPARWGEIGLEGHAGVVRFRRRFGQPRHLDDWERVRLVCRGLCGRASWSLNGDEVISSGDGEGVVEAEITPLLRERNELTVELNPGDPDQLVWEELALEIRCRAILRNVRAFAQSTADGWMILVFGEVVREQPGDSLEVYALIDGANQGYQQLQNDAEVSRVEFRMPWRAKPGDRGVTVRVDLVNVSTIWHSVECLVMLDG